MTDIALSAGNHGFQAPGLREALRRVKELTVRLGGVLVEKALLAVFVAKDSRTPPKDRATLLGAVAYLVLPADAIPDAIPVVGFTDDLTALSAALTVVAAHIRPEHRVAVREIMQSWGMAGSDKCNGGGKQT